MAADKALGFVALKSLTHGLPDPQTALDQIRRIYFKTTRETIEHDIAHAVTLLKSIPVEEVRDKAAVYMDGLSQMRSEWAQGTKRKTKRKGSAGRSRNTPTRG